MKYMGSKARFTKEILPIILKDRQPEQYYIEPFAGGMNMITEVDGNRIANDIHTELIEMWEALVCDDWIPNTFIEREHYNSIRANKKDYEPWLVGWVGFNCSYSGKYFGGYAGKVKTKIGTERNYQAEARKNVDKQIQKLKGVVFTNKKYTELEIPNNSIIYCDPPYQNTTKYSNEFNHNLFWDWVREKSKQGHKVYVSEYNAPSDFVCVWQKQAKSSLSANGVIGGNKISTEKLFVYGG